MKEDRIRATGIKADMMKIKIPRSLLMFSYFLASIYVQISPGLADNSSGSTKESQKSSGGGLTALEIFIVMLGISAALAFAVFLFKLWEKKKREEQHARLLKLFEEDDELEVELGLRD